MYIVLEIQTFDNGTVAVLPANVYNSRNEAESRYHTILAAAAVSSLPCHSAMMVSEDGFPLLHAAYRHDVQPAAEPAEDSGEG